MEKERVVDILLRLALAFAFIYAAIGGFATPTNWIGYFPSFLTESIPGATLLTLWGIAELALAAWILFGKNIAIPALVSTLLLLGVVVFNWNARDIIFRDISIAVIGIVLFLRHFQR